MGFVGTAGLQTPHLDALRASGHETNTIVVFLGDHGPCFQHGKMTLYDLGLRVPLVIRVPGLRVGTRTDALASELDLTPTLLDLLGLGPLPQSHGISLKPVLEGKPGAKGHEHVFAEISNRGTLPNDGMQEPSVFDGRWKLIYREKAHAALAAGASRQQAMETVGQSHLRRDRAHEGAIPRGVSHPRRDGPAKPRRKSPRSNSTTCNPIPTKSERRRRTAASRRVTRLYATLRGWGRDMGDPAVYPPADPPQH